MSFASRNDHSKHLIDFSKYSKATALAWKEDKSLSEWRSIKSSKDVLDLIDRFERTVLSSPKNIQERQYYKDEMFIAQYKAMKGIKKWCERLNVISINKDPNFTSLTEADVNNLITRLNSIIKQI